MGSDPLQQFFNVLELPTDRESALRQKLKTPKRFEIILCYELQNIDNTL